LPSHLNVSPPKLIKLPGRQKTKRIRKGALSRQPGNCRQTGHNTRRCTGLPVAKNGRGERARDWNAVDDGDSDIIVVKVGN
jgi:hypothetical protein